MQLIGDGFQATKLKKIVLTIFDYFKAFCRVWREDLLIRAFDKGLPNAYVQWLRVFLSNRKAKVQEGEHHNEEPTLQGAITRSRACIITARKPQKH